MEENRQTSGAIGGWLTSLVEAFFLPTKENIQRWLNPIWAVFLYLVGALHWCLFLSWGKIPFDLHDWTEAGAYYTFLRQAFQTNQLPLQIGSTLVISDRYLAIPQTLISPQAYLLRFLQPGTFVLVNMLILYTVGFIGLLLIRRRYSLAPAAFSLLVVLFNFNGFITTHYAVGHIEWTGYFFLPFFILLILKVIEGEPADWKWVLMIAGTLFLMSLQGAFHFVLWCVIFLLAWGIFSPRKYLIPALKAIIFSLLLCMFRFLPPAIEFFGGGGISFISGFPSVTDLFSSMILLKFPSPALAPVTEPLSWWELDYFIGLIGLAFILYFGVYQTWRKDNSHKSLLAPAAALTFLSIGLVYGAISYLPIPLLDSERVSSRFFILPLVGLIILGAINLQRFLESRGHGDILEHIFSLGLIALLAHDLFQHSRLWRVANMYQIFSSTPVYIQSAVIHHADPQYFGAVIGGTIVTTLVLIGLVYLWLRERRNDSAIRDLNANIR